MLFFSSCNPERYKLTKNNHWYFVAFTYNQATSKGALYIGDKKGYQIDDGAHVYVSFGGVFASCSYDCCCWFC